MIPYRMLSLPSPRPPVYSFENKSKKKLSKILAAIQLLALLPFIGNTANYDLFLRPPENENKN